MKIMTMNMRLETSHFKDLNHPWEKRLAGITQLIFDAKPNIIGTQELRTTQFEGLLKNLEHVYDGFGQSRIGHDDEKCAIFYLKDQYELLDEQTIWLSETPRIEGSKFKESAFPRILTSGQFKDLQTGKEFYVFNTHLDHESHPARLKQLQRIFNEISKVIKKYPVILTGDFNMTFHNEIYQGLDHTFYPHEQFCPHGLTFHNFKGEKEGKAIDYIFYSVKHFQLIQTKIIYDMYRGVYLSDHYPVIATFEWQ